jgi:hypothetical protein
VENTRVCENNQSVKHSRLDTRPRVSLGIPAPATRPSRFAKDSRIDRLIRVRARAEAFPGVSRKGAVPKVQTSWHLFAKLGGSLRVVIAPGSFFARAPHAPRARSIREMTRARPRNGSIGRPSTAATARRGKTARFDAPNALGGTSAFVLNV